jgi:hypothetical protein
MRVLATTAITAAGLAELAYELLDAHMGLLDVR